MCGAYSLTSYMNMHGWKPRFNIRPSQFAPIETIEGIKEARFGLIPSWSKEFKTEFSTINARSETIQKSKLYSRLLKKNRCLIPADGFFEWKHVDSKTKQPMYIKLKNRPLFYFAGIYETWHKGEKDEHNSFSIITTRPNAFMAEIHDRMPKILEMDQEKPWLKEEFINFDLFFKDQFPNTQLMAYPVSSLVNRPTNDSPSVIERIGQ